LRRCSVNRDPRLNRLPVKSGVAALLATFVIGTAGCSGAPVAPVAPSVASSGQVTPSGSPSSTRVVTPSPGVVATHLAKSVPVRLQIAAIGVDSTLMDLGLRADGTMEVPPGGFPAGWFTGAPTPGELGPGVFYNLQKLKPGDKITVTRKDGSRPVFQVTRVAQFPKEKFPTALVYGNLDHAGLRLITCGGSFNSATGHYEDNFVAFADLVEPTR
jgi:hypothetical protein